MPPGTLFLTVRHSIKSFNLFDMALVKFGTIITSGSGSLGGSTIQPFHSCHTWRKKPLPRKSCTPAQYKIRSYIKTMQAGWRSILEADRKIWNNYAKEKPVYNRSGEKHSLSGHSLWMKYQYNRLSLGLPFLTDPSLYAPDYYGPELVKNGGFDNADDWVHGAGWSITGGKAIYLGAEENYLRQLTLIPLNVYYNVTFDISNCPGVGRLGFYTYTGRAYLFYTPLSGGVDVINGSYSFTAQSRNITSDGFYLYGDEGRDTFIIDNLSIREVYR